MKRTSEKDAAGAVQICFCGPASWESHLLICSLPRPPLGFFTDVLAEVSPKVSLANKAHIPQRPPRLPLPGLRSAVPEEFPAVSPIWGSSFTFWPTEDFSSFFPFFKKIFLFLQWPFSGLCFWFVILRKRFFCLNSCHGSKNTVVPSPGVRAPCASCRAIFLSDSQGGWCQWGMAIFGHDSLC